MDLHDLFPLHDLDLLERRYYNVLLPELDLYYADLARHIITVG